MSEPTPPSANSVDEHLREKALVLRRHYENALRHLRWIMGSGIAAAVILCSVVCLGIWVWERHAPSTPGPAAKSEKAPAIPVRTRCTVEIQPKPAGTWHLVRDATGKPILLARNTIYLLRTGKARGTVACSFSAQPDTITPRSAATSLSPSTLTGPGCSLLPDDPVYLLLQWTPHDPLQSLFVHLEVLDIEPVEYRARLQEKDVSVKPVTVPPKTS